MTMMDCTDVLEQLSAYVDGELDRDARAAVAAHLETCAACRDVAADLARLRDAARSLAPMAPPPQVWAGIAAALPAGRRQARNQWMGLAAALVLVTAGAYLVTRSAAPTRPVVAVDADKSNGKAPATVETIEDELAKAAEHYETAIAQLEAVAKQDENAMPADTAAKLQVSLSQVDKYISESRAALATEPQSEPARDTLFAALRRKVEILQQTVSLMGAMQRGDRETAAKVMGGKSS